MSEKPQSKPEPKKPQKKILIIALGVAIIGLLIFWLVQQTAPQRSIAAYCQTHKEEKTRLAKLPGDTWPAGVFNDELSDASEIAKSVGRLEKVAPEEIRSDVATIQSIYQKIHEDPSQAIGASLSGVEAEANVKKWTSTNCTE